MLMSISSHFRLSYMTKNEKNQLYCLCLKMTADFGNFVAKTDEKRKMKWNKHLEDIYSIGKKMS